MVACRATPRRGPHSHNSAAFGIHSLTFPLIQPYLYVLGVVDVLRRMDDILLLCRYNQHDEVAHRPLYSIQFSQ